MVRSGLLVCRQRKTNKHTHRPLGNKSETALGSGPSGPSGPSPTSRGLDG